MDEYLSRYLQDVQYDLVVPPHGINYSVMTSKKAKEAFEWFVANIPKRMEYFRYRCAEDLMISVDALDYSADTLILVWRWFLKTARTEATPEEELKKMEEGAKLFGDSFVNREVFTPATVFIMRDIAMYVGQCYVLNYRGLHWMYQTKPKSSVTVNQPMVAGFRMTYMGKEGPMFFAPLHIVNVQAAKIFSLEQDERDLYNVFMYWQAMVPIDSE